MKSKNLFLKIYIPFAIITVIALIVLQILGSKKRIGYLTDFDLLLDKTLEINNLESINESATNYVHHFRIRYYDKVFRHNDIYGVYPDLNNLSDFVKEVKMDYDGSPFGILISDKLITEEKIDNVSYILKLKYPFIKLIICLDLILFIVIIFKKYFWHNSGFNISKYSEITIEENNPIYEILLSIPALWIFIASVSVIISEITNKVNYTSYSPYTIYPAIFILLFMVFYLSLYKKINQKTKYIIRLNLIYMLLYFFVYCFRNNSLIYIIIVLHIILIILTPIIYKLKLVIEYNFQNKSKYYYLIRNQLIIAFLFIIFYLCFNTELYLSLIYLIEASVIFLCRDLYKIYNKNIYKIVATIFTIFTLIFLVSDKMYNDFWSDANVHAAGLNFKESGFLKYYFLPDFSLPYQDSPQIYTHYPPLPDIMFGILYKILPEPKGEVKNEWYMDGGNLDNYYNWIENISPMLWKYRMFPMLWHIIGSFFLWVFFTKISKDKFITMIATLLTISQPALLYCKFNLHYLTYASAVLMATPYIIYQFLNTNKNRYGFILILFGFLQGALSFDFILPGVGISLLFLFFPLNESISFNWKLLKKLLCPTIILTLGVIIAFILHFIQNSLYFGSVKLAFDDLFGALLYRTSKEHSEIPYWLTVENFYFYNLIKDYYSVSIYSYGFSFPLAFISILFSYICAIFGYLKFKLSSNKIKIKSDYFKRALFFLLGALAVSSTWILIMKNHSSIHTLHISRHFIVLFIALMTFLVSLFNLFIKTDKDN